MDHPDVRIILLLLSTLMFCSILASADDSITHQASSPSSSSFLNQSDPLKVKFIDTGNPNMHIVVGLAFPKSELTAGSLMSANLISMANSSQAEEFLQMMGNAIKDSLIPPPAAASQPQADAVKPEKQSRSNSTPLNTMDEAACEPEMRTIDLSEYTFTSRDPDIAVYPRCVRVPRCGGCCGPSDMLQCMPTKVTMNNVVLRKWSARHAKKSMTQELVPIEYHEACACQCRIQEKDCDPEKQRYSKEKCKCLCLSSRDHKKCAMNPDKVWNPSDCTCRCRNVKRCSTGLKMNPDTCSCQVIGGGDE